MPNCRGASFLLLEFDEDGEGAGGYAKIMSDEFIKKEMELFERQATEVDIIITTAQIPGRKAPLLITKKCAELLKPGSVVVDIAALFGGNCELTKPGEVVYHNGVSIVGLTDLPNKMAYQASLMYSQNLVNLMDHMGKVAGFKVDFERSEEHTSKLKSPVTVS